MQRVTRAMKTVQPQDDTAHTLMDSSCDATPSTLPGCGCQPFPRIFPRPFSAWKKYSIIAPR